MMIPGIVEAEATIPVQSVGVPRYSINGFRTGSFDIVELRMAKNPMIMIARNTLVWVVLFIFIVCPYFRS